MILQSLFGRKPGPATRLYGAIVAAARQEKFYSDMGVPDTLDGRFDMIVVHMFLVLNRLRGGNEKFRQELTDVFFADLDRTLREMGVGDLSVSKKIRPMAEAFAGRIQAYATAIEQGDGEMLQALQRNVYSGENNVAAPQLLAWFKDWKLELSKVPVANLLGGELIKK
jgi:cytochrome b pre-mRNA-processing protein 3